MQLAANGRIRRNAEHFDDQGIFLGGEASNPQFSLRHGNRFFRLSPAGLEHNLFGLVAVDDPGSIIGQMDGGSSGAVGQWVQLVKFRINGSGTVRIRLDIASLAGQQGGSHGQIRLRRGANILWPFTPTQAEHFDFLIPGNIGVDADDELVFEGNSGQPPPQFSPNIVGIGNIRVMARQNHVEVL